MIPGFRELEAEQGCTWNLSHFHSLYSIHTVTLAECVSLEGTGLSLPSGEPALSLHPMVQVTKHHVECSALTLEQRAAGSLPGHLSELHPVNEVNTKGPQWSYGVAQSVCFFKTKKGDEKLSSP